MIIREYKLVFVHIPKTAGVSVVHALLSTVLGYETKGKIGELESSVKKRFELRGPQKHKKARAIVSNEVSLTEWEHYYKFAFVRNPWDRAVSEYCWRQMHPQQCSFKTFSEFLDYCEYRLNDTHNVARDIYWDHAQQQSAYVTDVDGNTILNDVFRFENMSAAIGVVGAKLDVVFDIHQHNKSSHPHYAEYYSTKLKDKIARLYAPDIEMFEYEF